MSFLLSKMVKRRFRDKLGILREILIEKQCKDWTAQYIFKLLTKISLNLMGRKRENWRWPCKHVHTTFPCFLHVNLYGFLFLFLT